MGHTSSSSLFLSFPSSLAALVNPQSPESVWKRAGTVVVVVAVETGKGVSLLVTKEVVSVLTAVVAVVPFPTDHHDTSRDIKQTNN